LVHCQSLPPSVPSLFSYTTLFRSDAAVVFSERDRRGLAQGSWPARAELVTIPLGWEVPPAALDPDGAEPPTLLFVGNFIHPPNEIGKHTSELQSPDHLVCRLLLEK